MFNSKELKELFARIERLETLHKNHESNFLAYNSKMNNIYRNIQDHLNTLEKEAKSIAKDNMLIRSIINDDLEIKKTNTERLKNLAASVKRQDEETKNLKENIEKVRKDMTDPMVNSVMIKHDRRLDRIIDEFKEFKKKALIIDDKSPT